MNGFLLSPLQRKQLGNVPKSKVKNYTESQIQIQCVQHFKMHHPNEANLLIYVCNNSSNPIQGHRNRLLGTVAGFPDTFLFLPRKGYSGLAVEFKAPKEKPRPNQRAIHAQLIGQGYKVATIDSFEAFKELIADYLA